MAQSVEHILGKDEVIGSIPIISSSKIRILLNAVCGFFILQLLLSKAKSPT